MYHFFIGIDISKDDFVVALHTDKKAVTYSNQEGGFHVFCKDHHKYFSHGLIVLETTGGYEKALLRYLQKLGCFVHRADTRKVKYFIRSLGTVAKTDSIDAFCLALYASERHSKLSLYQENPQEKLLKLVQRRQDLKKMLVQEKNRFQAPEQKEFKKSFEAIICNVLIS